MSTETPETKNPYQVRREAINRAIKAWQEHGDGDAMTFEDALMDEKFVVLPRSTGHGKWIVTVDGQPAARPGKDRPAGPVDAEEAAEMFLTLTGSDYYNECQVTVRPASSDELVASVWDHITGGAA